MSKESISCLNGQFMGAAQALLPVSGRGFRFGDGVFETIRLVAGAPYQWAQHLARLEGGMRALRIVPPDVDWADFARRMIAENGATEGFLRLAVSRGGGSFGYLPQDASATADWVIEYFPAWPAPAQPYRLWLSSYARMPIAALPVNYKLAQGVGSTLALLEAREHGCDEALQLSTDGAICSAASANIFWVRDGKMFTPALLTGCRDGTTRAAVMRLSTVEEVLAPADVLREADAVFLTSCRLGIWPVAWLEPWGVAYAPHLLVERLQSMLEKDRNNVENFWEIRS